MSDLYQHLVYPLVVVVPVWCYILLDYNKSDDYEVYRRRIQWLGLSLGSFIGSVFPDLMDLLVLLVNPLHMHERGLFHSINVFFGVAVFMGMFMLLDFFYMSRAHTHNGGQYASQRRHHWQDVARRRMEDKFLFLLGFIFFWGVHLVMDTPIVIQQEWGL